MMILYSHQRCCSDYLPVGLAQVVQRALARGESRTSRHPNHSIATKEVVTVSAHV